MSRLEGLMDECPECDGVVSLSAEVCPHCGFAIVSTVTKKTTPAAKTKESPAPKKAESKTATKPQAAPAEVKSTVRPEIKQANAEQVVSDTDRVLGQAGQYTGRGRVYVPGLHNKKVPSYDGDPGDKQAILDWAYRTRQQWLDNGDGYLSNHALGYICMYASEVKSLESHSKQVVDFLGGDEYK